MTEKPKLVIPWGKMIEDLASWIKKECYPKGFQWKHPSKIKIQDIFGLLDYWRERSAEGEEPLIWVTTSPLFDVIHRPSGQSRSIRRSPIQEESSDGERFSLPHSSEMDEGEDEDAGVQVSATSEESWMGIQDLSDDDNESVIISTQKDVREPDTSAPCECKNVFIILAFMLTPNKLHLVMVRDHPHHQQQVRMPMF